jgi:hypothetical protein
VPYYIKEKKICRAEGKPAQAKIAHAGKLGAKPVFQICEFCFFHIDHRYEIFLLLVLAQKKILYFSNFFSKRY